jgi:hypothetical protein
MKYAEQVCLASVFAFSLQAVEIAAHTREGVISTAQIAKAVEGRACATKAGATFTFGRDGEYSYEGLWKSAGRYEIRPGSIMVTFDSGLQRSFAVSMKSGALLLEGTLLLCTKETAITHTH